MPKPQGTYLRISANEKSATAAKDAKADVALAKERENQKFLQALHKVSESKLKTWHKSMSSLSNAIRKSEPLSKEDKVRKAVSDVLGEVKKILVQAKNLKTLESTLQQPATAVLRTPRDLGTAGAELTLVIALVQVLSILVRIRGDRHTR